MRVIVAEDDIISRKALVASIEDLGYEVVETQNGEEAWQTLSFPKSEKPAGIEKNDIHLAILDW